MFKGDNLHITLFEKALSLAFSQTPLNEDLSNFAWL